MVATTSQVNLEEAAHVGNEFIYSLDNLPREVQFLLEEMQHKDDRACRLQREIDNSGSTYLRQSLRPSSSQSTPDPCPSTDFDTIPPQIAKLWGELHDINEEKLLLAEKLYNLLVYSTTRLAIEHGKVQTLEGKPSEPPTPSIPTTVARQLADSLHGALETSSLASSSHGPPHRQNLRKRKAPGATPNIPVPQLPQPDNHIEVLLAPVPVSASSATVTDQIVDDTEQGGPEDDLFSMLDAEEGDDDKLYCYCQKPSFGDMISCDGQQCTYEWFHLSCVGLSSPLPRTWYCENCTSSPSRSMRKKKS